MHTPSVTAVVPTFRRLDYLPQALESALKQTFRDFELIVTDDGNSPEVARIAAAFADPRIRYRANPRPLGIALNHYAAFREARGEFIASLHDDDLWEPGFLAELVPPLLADPSITVAFCDHQLIDSRGNILAEQTQRNTRTYCRDVLPMGRHQPFFKIAVVDESIPMAMGAVFRKSILDGADYSPRVGGTYDYWLAWLASRHGAAAYYVPGRLTRYRLHPRSGTSTAGNAIRNLRAGIYVRSHLLRMPELAPWRKTIANNLGVFYGKLALLLLAEGRHHRAWILEKKAFSLFTRPKNVLGLLKNTLIGLARAAFRK